MIKVITMSGGKDSTALALYAMNHREAGDELRFVFCDVGNEHQLTYQYLRYLDGIIRQKGFNGLEYLRASFVDRLNQKRETLKENPRDDWEPKRLQSALDNLRPSYNPFLDLCMLKGRFPSALARFCTQELKLEPIKDYIRQFLHLGYDCENLVGVRADESKSRALLPDSELFLKNEATGAECWTVRPLLKWTAKECFAYLKENGIEPNPLYKQGFMRVGCMPCIMTTKGELKEIAERFPSEIYRIEAWENQVSASCKRGSSTFFYDSEGGSNRIWDKVRWSRGDNIPDLFESEFVCCKSYYGLCE